MRDCRSNSPLLHAAVIAAAAAAPSALAGVVLLDDFDDGVLDPAWQVVFEDCNGWTAQESGTELVVTDLDSAVINDAGGPFTWARVHLVRSIAPLDDFHVQVDMAWDSQSLASAMQVLSIELRDARGMQAATVYYSDAWVADYGGRGASIEDDGIFSGQGTMPQGGTALVEIDRVGTDVTVRWDGQVLLTGTSDLTIEQVWITFDYYAYQGVSIFGTESVDMIQVVDTAAVPSADFNGDSEVGVTDLLQLLAAWGACPGCVEDLDGDGFVGVTDLLALLSAWGPVT